MTRRTPTTPVRLRGSRAHSRGSLLRQFPYHPPLASLGILEDQKASSSSPYAWPMSFNEARARFASSSSILDIANPTWMRTQSPAFSCSSSNNPMLMTRVTPETSARASWSLVSTNSTSRPGIPRHIVVSSQLRYSIDSSINSPPPSNSTSIEPHAGHAIGISSQSHDASQLEQPALTGSRMSSAAAFSATVPMAAIMNDCSNASGWTWWSFPTLTRTCATGRSPALLSIASTIEVQSPSSCISGLLHRDDLDADIHLWQDLEDQDPRRLHAELPDVEARLAGELDRLRVDGLYGHHVLVRPAYAPERDVAAHVVTVVRARALHAGQHAVYRRITPRFDALLHLAVFHPVPRGQATDGK